MNFTRDAIIAAELSVADRMRLFCLASPAAPNGGTIAVVLDAHPMVHYGL